MIEALIGVFPSEEAARRAALDLQAADFSPTQVAGDQVPELRDLTREGRNALMVDPAGREPEARAIMMRAGAERFIDHNMANDGNATLKVGSPDVDAYLESGAALPVDKDPGSPLPDAHGAQARGGSSAERDATREDAKGTPMREVDVRAGDTAIDDKMRRGVERNMV